MKTRYDRAAAMIVAKSICGYLNPHCERLIVAGSLRCRRLQVGDIEIVYIPKLLKERDGLFDEIELNTAEASIQALLEAGIIKQRPNIDGHFSWGLKNKFAIHADSSIPIDFFATTEANWWVTKVIRTGGKDTNLALTTGAQALGRKLHAYGAGFTDTDGALLVCTSEQDVFKYAGVPYVEPWDRR